MQVMYAVTPLQVLSAKILLKSYSDLRLRIENIKEHIANI